ncbi:hypothetical protein RIF29_11582 [Crotalaria pallida]|uniref:Uncharacterized protein n=1 Tax=Crotalaria pallida TaxID=3830 RepID=A0AAN9IM91_CROPI
MASQLPILKHVKIVKIWKREERNQRANESYGREREKVQKEREHSREEAEKPKTTPSAGCNRDREREKERELVSDCVRSKSDGD